MFYFKNETNCVVRWMCVCCSLVLKRLRGSYLHDHKQLTLGMHEDLWTVRLMVTMATMDLRWFKTPLPSFLTFDSNRPVSFCSLTSVQIEFCVWGNSSNNLIITRKWYQFVSMRWIHLYYSNRMNHVSPTVAVFTPVVRAMVLMYITTVGVAYIWSSSTLFIFSPKLSSHGSFKWTFKVKAVKAAGGWEWTHTTYVTVNSASFTRRVGHIVKAGN